MSNNRERKEEILIADMFNGSMFCKIKPAFSIGKVLFSFVEKTAEGTLKSNVDVYLKISKAYLFAKEIKSLNIAKKIAKSVESAKAIKNDYPNNVWESGYGGGSENGKVVSRSLSLAPGMLKGNNCKYAVFTANKRPGIEDNIGKIIPNTNIKKNDENASQFATIRVAVDEDGLKEIGLMLDAAIELVYFPMWGEKVVQMEASRVQKDSNTTNGQTQNSQRSAAPNSGSQKQEQQKQDSPDSTNPQKEAEIENIEIKTTTVLQKCNPNSDNLCLKANVGGQEKIIIFLADQMNGNDTFNGFRREAMNKDGVVAKMKLTKKKERYYFLDFVS